MYLCDMNFLIVAIIWFLISWWFLFCCLVYQHHINCWNTGCSDAIKIWCMDLNSYSLLLLLFHSVQVKCFMHIDTSAFRCWGHHVFGLSVGWGGVEAYFWCFASSSVQSSLLLDVTSFWLYSVIYVTELTSPKWLFFITIQFCYDLITIRSQNCIVS